MIQRAPLRTSTSSSPDPHTKALAKKWLWIAMTLLGLTLLSVGCNSGGDSSGGSSGGGAGGAAPATTTGIADGGGAIERPFVVEAALADLPR